MGMVAAERVFNIIETESSIRDEGKTQISHLKGYIDIYDLRFSYIDDEEVLKGISLEVIPGETVAIVGATGAGKSTLINLITRFYEYDEGDIRLTVYPFVISLRTASKSCGLSDARCVFICRLNLQQHHTVQSSLFERRSCGSSQSNWGTQIYYVTS